MGVEVDIFSEEGDAAAVGPVGIDSRIKATHSGNSIMTSKFIRLGTVVGYSDDVSCAKESVNCGCNLNLGMLYGEAFDNERGGKGFFWILDIVRG
jgi:hypothetical protein